MNRSVEMHSEKPEKEKCLPLEKVGEMLVGLRYGTLELTVHDGRVVQIERRERLRIG